MRINYYDEFIESNRIAVLKHFGKTEADINNDVKIITEWFEKQQDLPSMNVHKIEMFLCRKKFSLEKTKKIIEMFHLLKNLVPEMYTNWDPLSPELQQAMDVCMSIPLRKLTPDLHAVHISKIFDTEPKRFNLWETCKLTHMITLLHIRNEFNLGVHFIIDLNGVSLGHIQPMTPALLKKILIVLRKGCGLRIAGIHFLNPILGLDKIYLILKYLLKPKIYNRIKIHHKLESLYEYVPKEMLPQEYGGDEPSIFTLRDQLREELEAHRDLLIEDLKLKCSDTRQFERLDEDIFGSMHGSFRALQID